MTKGSHTCTRNGGEYSKACRYHIEYASITSAGVCVEQSEVQWSSSEATASTVHPQVHMYVYCASKMCTGNIFTSTLLVTTLSSH